MWRGEKISGGKISIESARGDGTLGKKKTNLEVGTKKSQG